MDARKDAHTHARTDNVKTVYPPQTKFAGGIKAIFSQTIGTQTWYWEKGANRAEIGPLEMGRKSLAKALTH